MIRLLRRNPGEDVLLTVDDGFDNATVYLTKGDVDRLIARLGEIRNSQGRIIDIETAGYVPLVAKEQSSE